MNGRVLVNPPIAVDCWNLTFCHDVELFFLTHVHSDHTRGLSSTWSKPIFCSSVTKKLIVQKFKIKEDYVHALEMCQSRVIPLNSGSNESMKVTLMDANHCPGSAMFHFEGSFGQILFTGDFRYSEELCKQLVEFVPHCEIDYLYLDDTYWDCRNEIPPRQEAIDKILELIEKYPGHKILIALYSVGKEYLLEAISRQLDTAICVPKKRISVLEIMKCRGRYTTDRSITDIQVVYRWNISRELQASTSPTIAIIPSGFFGNISQHDERIFQVPLSDHSSHDELKAFIRFLKPKHIIGITNYKSKTNFVDKSSYGSNTLTRLSKLSHSASMPNSVTRRFQKKCCNKHLFYKNRHPKSSLKYGGDDTSIRPKSLSKIDNDSETKSAICLEVRLDTFKKKEILIKCCRCCKKFPNEDAKYNRNKDKMYYPGLCSKCDVEVSQALEETALKKSKDSIEW